jgi:hypothetical protein
VLQAAAGLNTDWAHCPAHNARLPVLHLTITCPSHQPAKHAEAAANNPRPAAPAAFFTDIRKGFERLLRKLLNYPLHPAVVMLQNYQWVPSSGKYWTNAESAFYEYATYYGIPQVSVKAACHRWAPLLRPGSAHGSRGCEAGASEGCMVHSIIQATPACSVPGYSTHAAKAAPANRFVPTPTRDQALGGQRARLHGRHRAAGP